MYYIFEGADGTGKSSIMMGVYDKLEEQGIDCTYIREPKGRFRELLFEGINPQSAFLVFMADRIDTYKKIDFENELVLSDRSFISSIIYQYLYEGVGNCKLLWELLKFIQIPEINKIFVCHSEEYYGDKSNDYDLFGQRLLRDYYLNIYDILLDRYNVETYHKETSWGKEYKEFLEMIKEKKVLLTNNSEEEHKQCIEKVYNEIIGGL